MATKVSWLEKVKEAKKTLLVQDGRQKIHFLFPNNIEMVEEYDVNNHQLLCRKWKQRSTLGGDGKWEFEVGDPPLKSDLLGEDLIESHQNPRFSRCDVPKSFQWRIRNLPYPINVYNISVENDYLILRTTNKKYYKKFDIPDLKRLELSLDPNLISLNHSNNTLIITYKKPLEFLQYEKLLKEHLQTLKPVDEDQNNCKTS